MVRRVLSRAPRGCCPVSSVPVEIRLPSPSMIHSRQGSQFDRATSCSNSLNQRIARAREPNCIDGPPSMITVNGSEESSRYFRDHR